MDAVDAADVAELAVRVLAERWEPWPGPATTELRARRADLAPAVEALLAADDTDTAARLVGGLAGFWQSEGLVAEGRTLTATVLEHAPDDPSPVWGRAWLAEGVLAFRQADQEAATSATRRAAAAASQADDAVLLAEAETNLARIAFRDGDAERILHHADRVADLAGDDLPLLTRAVHMRAWGRYTAGDVEGAVAEFERNIALYEQLGRVVDAASERANIADLALEQGDLGTARSRLHEAVATPGVADDGYLAPSLVLSAAVVLGSSGAPGPAHTLFAAADALYAASGLVPDPGDGVSDGVRDSVRCELDPDVAESAAARGRSMSLAEAVGLARAALAG
jgi:tetratricopeptide (TPR) repeat protein